MAIIGMIGPHAVGKTAAARRWAAKYGSRLTVAITDNQWEECAGIKTRIKDWKGTKEQKAARALYHRDRDGITLVESARGFSTWLSVFRPTDPVIVLTCPEPNGREWIVQRRLAKGNPKPISDYWTPRRLDYECNGHLLNVAARLAPGQAKHFVIEDRERDWERVDEYFALVFRRLWNELVRRSS